MRRELIFYLIFLMVCSIFWSVTIPFVDAEDEEFLAIYIRPDGSVEPTTALVIRDGDFYYITQDLYGKIIVQRDGVVLNGLNHMIYGKERYFESGITLNNVENVTIINVTIKEFGRGIHALNSRSNIICNVRIIGLEESVNGYVGLLLESSFNNNITRIHAMYLGYGIVLRNSSHNLISENRIVVEDHVGITLEYNSDHNIIVDNLIRRVGYGILLATASYNLISSNNITCTFVGLYAAASKYNTVMNNTITACHDGFLLIDSSGNFEGNILAFNTYGAYLINSSNLEFRGNYFIDNRVNLYLKKIKDYSSITFNRNFWHDYKGSDSNRDGIGDTPYKIDNLAVDPSPLIYAETGNLTRPQVHSEYYSMLRTEDRDLDGISNAIEEKYPYSIWLDPDREDELLENVYSFLNSDGLDEYEKAFLDFLQKIERELIPLEIRSIYYSKPTIRLVNYSFRNFAWGYITPNEIKWYQLLLVISVLNNGRVSALEAEAVNSLNNYVDQNRWYLVLDIIASRMISDEYLQEDFDLDGLSNYEELKLGSNPLNCLETNSTNLSERYMIIIPPLKCGTPACSTLYSSLELYHVLKKHGYCDDNIILGYLKYSEELFQVGMLSYLKDLDLMRDLGNVTVDFWYFNWVEESEEFLNLLKNNKPWDGNDVVIIFEMGHGSYLCSNKEEPDWAYNLLDDLKPYGKIIWFRSTCFAGTFFETYFYRGYPENFVGIASSTSAPNYTGVGCPPPTAMGGFEHFECLFYFDFQEIIPRIVNWSRSPFEVLVSNTFLSIKEVADKRIDRMYFYCNDKEENWLETWNLIHYIPYKKFPMLYSEGIWYKITARLENGTLVSVPFTLNEKEYVTQYFGYQESKRFKIKVDEIFVPSDGVRYLFIEWSDGLKDSSRTIYFKNQLVELEAVYKVQYYLEVISEYGYTTGGGWYDKGAEAVVKVQPTIGFLIEHHFVEWIIDEGTPNEYRTANKTLVIVMNAPHKVKALWRTSYNYTQIIILILVTVASLTAAFLIYQKRKRQ